MMGGGSLADDHIHFGRAIINLGTTCNNLPWLLGVGSLDELSGGFYATTCPPDATR